jgi:hypothetical protein
VVPTESLTGRRTEQGSEEVVLPFTVLPRNVLKEITEARETVFCLYVLLTLISDEYDTLRKEDGKDLQKVPLKYTVHGLAV